MLNKVALGLVLGAAAAGAFAQAAGNQPPSSSGTAYAKDANGGVARSQYGLCWRSGYWTPGDAMTGCDGELTPPVANPTAPPIVANPTAPAPVQSAAPSPKRCDFAVTLTSDQTFGFDRSALSGTAKKRIDDEVVAKLASCASVERLSVTGHTDRLGTVPYNQALSEQRAAAVAAYLKAKGIKAPIDAAGAGETRPTGVSCGARQGSKALITCLSPDRRVVIEASGTGR